MSELKVAPQKVVGNSATDDSIFKQVIKGLSQHMSKRLHIVRKLFLI